MTEQGQYAFATVVLGSNDQIVLLRPAGGLLAMTFLNFASEIRPPSEFVGEVPPAETGAQEMKMANLLIESMADDDFDFTQYKDTYNERLQQLIDAKISGKEIVTPPNEALPHVPDLLDALRQSLETSKPAKKKPARLAAPTKPAAAPTAKRRKTS